MDMKSICPCPNVTCNNHGICDDCTSRHLRQGHLNFCGFQTILPTLKEAIELDPDCATAQKLNPLIELMQEAYRQLREKHGLSEEEQNKKLQQVAEHSKHKEA